MVFGNLLIPDVIDPSEMVVPASLVVIVLVRLQWTYYKKHL